MKIVLSAILFSSLYLGAIAQQNDTLITDISDTLFTVSSDSIETPEPKKKSDLDTVVYASGSDSLFFFVKEKKMSIYGEGKINYRNLRLKVRTFFLTSQNLK